MTDSRMPESGKMDQAPDDTIVTSGLDPFRKFQHLITILRAENGCPWDRKQTPATIKKYLLDEAAELAEAIDQEDPGHICEETGDLFYILLMLCRMFEEQNLFSADTALEGIFAKMVRRHPHVFAGQPTGSEEELRRQWEAIKKEEKKNC
jgi:uncharacterized protein YabN with tetrapyrrole methylase and pyrophosphatase domain